MSYPDLLVQLYQNARALRKFTWVVTDERTRIVEDMLSRMSNRVQKLCLMPDGHWASSVGDSGKAPVGMRPLPSSPTIGYEWLRHSEPPSSAVLVEAFRALHRLDPRDMTAVCLIPDASPLEDPEVRKVIWDMKHQLDADERTVKVLIFCSNTPNVPEEFRGFFGLVEDTGFTVETAQAYLDDVLRHIGKDSWTFEPGCAEACVGLSKHQVTETIRITMMQKRKLSRPITPITAEDIQLGRVKAEHDREAMGFKLMTKTLS